MLDTEIASNNEVIITDEVKTKKKPDPRALNAYRHGLTGHVIIVTPEDEEAYKLHCEKILDFFKPVGAMEVEIAQEIADDRWRIKHANAMFINTFAYGLTKPDAITAHHPQIDTAFAQARVWGTDSKNASLLNLYEQRLQRKELKNIALLRQFQQDRREALNQAVEEAALLAQLAASKGETLDIERDLPRLSHYPQFDFSSPEIAALVVHVQLLAEARRRFGTPKKPLRMAA